jgi:hypothetical protein
MLFNNDITLSLNVFLEISCTYFGELPAHHHILASLLNTIGLENLPVS